MDEQLYEEWRRHHLETNNADLVTPRRAYLAGLSEGRKNRQFAGAMVTRCIGHSRRMRAALNTPEASKTLADRRDLEDLDRDLRDWIERPCQEWQNTGNEGREASRSI
jgi:hypothetical protein